MTSFAQPRFQPTKFFRGEGPIWLRSLLLGVLAGFILAILVMAPATRSQLEAAPVDDDTRPVSLVNSAYGSKDPYGFGPRAGMAPDSPGGGADQESLSATSPGPQTDAANSK